MTDLIPFPHKSHESHARPGWTTSIRGQDSPWKSQSEWQRTEINGESTSVVWPALGSRTAEEQNWTTMLSICQVIDHVTTQIIFENTTYFVNNKFSLSRDGGTGACTSSSWCSWRYVMVISVSVHVTSIALILGMWMIVLFNLWTFRDGKVSKTYRN